jgi:MoxR-like ATPase
MTYTARADSVEILKRHKVGPPVLKPVAAQNTLLEAQRFIPDIYVHEDLLDYIVALTEATRTHDAVMLGVSARGALTLMRAAQACAAIEGRAYVIPDDVKQTAVPVMAHRLILKGAERTRRDAAPNIVRDLLDRTPVPTEFTWAG